MPAPEDRLINVEDGRTRTIAPYQLHGWLGGGRHAEVYEAYDQQNSTHLAFKLYRNAGPEATELATKEAEILTKLEKLGTEFFPERKRRAKWIFNNENHPFVVMEAGYLVDGEGRRRVVSLDDVLQRPADSTWELFWDQQQLCQWTVDLLSACSAMHSVDIVHRDLKPANILLKSLPGSTRIVPFLVDFNVSGRSGDLSDGGTVEYLPPEAKGGSMELRVADDLWAVASIIGSVMYGSTGEQRLEISWPVPDSLKVLLQRAREVDPAARFGSASEFRDVLEGALLPDASKSNDVSAEEMGWFRSEGDRLRAEIGGCLAGPGEVFVPKEVRDEVAVLYAGVTQSGTQAFDLTEDTLALGPYAIPSIMESAYKLRPRSQEFRDILDGLAALAVDAPDRTRAAIAEQCLSGNPVVRSMAMGLAASVEFVPDELEEALCQGSNLFSASELKDLAAHCIRFGRSRDCLVAILSFMSREYCEDKNRYRDLRREIADRICSMAVDGRAQVIVEFVSVGGWRSSRTYKESNYRPTDIDRGVTELLGDAYASLGDEGLALLKGHSREPYWRVFARKFANTNSGREWLSKRLEDDPSDEDTQYALRTGKFAPREIDVAATLEVYLRTNDRGSLNALRFSRTGALSELGRATDEALFADPRRSRSVIELLKGFESRYRHEVVGYALEYWDHLVAVDRELLASVVSDYSVPDKQLEDQVVQKLKEWLGGPHDSVARSAIERLLGE